MDYKISCKPFDDGTPHEPDVVRDVDHFEITGGEWPFVRLLDKNGEMRASFNLACVDTVRALTGLKVAV